MTATLKINSRGTATFPKPLREALGVGEGGTVSYSFHNGAVVFQPAAPKYPPIEIYTDERIAEFEEVLDEGWEVFEKRLKEKGWFYDPQTWTFRDKFGNEMPPVEQNNISEPLMVRETNDTPYGTKKARRKKA